MPVTLTQEQVSKLFDPTPEAREALKALGIELADPRSADPPDTRDFQTETLTGIEIAEVGVHVDMHGTEWSATEAVLDRLVGHHVELEKLGWRVPLRFGTHTFDDPSPIGLIALGWMVNPRRVGQKLLVDFEKVPVVIAQLIRKGGLPRLSPGILFNLNVNGYKASEAFDHVALLGVRVPAMLGLKANDTTPVEQIAALYGATLESVKVDRPEFTHEGVFESGPTTTPPKAEGGNVDKTVSLEAFGLNSEEELKGKLDLARQAEAATAAKVTAEKERDDAATERDAVKVELETERDASTRARAVAFFEKHPNKVRPADKEKYLRTYIDLAKQEPMEFESGEGDAKTTTKFTALAVFESSVDAMPDVIDKGEGGKAAHKDPRDGEQTKDDDETSVVHAELADKAGVRATELMAEAKTAGETLDRPTAYRTALLELSSGEEVEE